MEQVSVPNVGVSLFYRTQRKATLDAERSDVFETLGRHALAVRVRPMTEEGPTFTTRITASVGPAGFKQGTITCAFEVPVLFTKRFRNLSITGKKRGSRAQADSPLSGSEDITSPQCCRQKCVHELGCASDGARILRSTGRPTKPHTRDEIAVSKPSNDLDK